MPDSPQRSATSPGNGGDDAKAKAEADARAKADANRDAKADADADRKSSVVKDGAGDPVRDFTTEADALAQAKAIGKGAVVEHVGVAFHVADKPE